MAEGQKILVVDDETEIRELLQFYLGLRGYAVRTAPDGVAGLGMIREWHPEAIILDVVMPKIDGVALLPMVRRLTEAPVIMLTAKGEVNDVVKGLEGGADDYVTKPFEVAELVARLQTALRRPALDRREALTLADLTVDVKKYAVARGDVPIALTAREFRLLETMLRHPGQVFSRRALFETVWGLDSDADEGIVDRTISNVRAKIDQNFEKKLIQTIRGIGFTVRE